MMKMNLPNRLTVLRLMMVPSFVFIMMAADVLWTNIAGLLLFCVASLTDMLDGKIARKRGLVTDFGKFLDPLADKFMVIGALMVLLWRFTTDGNTSLIFRYIFFWAVLLVIFRELAVTSIRLVVSGTAGIVVAATMLGKIKTCTQIACVIACIAERIFYRYIPALNFLLDILPLSFFSTCLMLFFTLWSGFNYLRSYWKYMDPEK